MISKIDNLIHRATVYTAVPGTAFIGHQLIKSSTPENENLTCVLGTKKTQQLSRKMFTE